MLSNRGKLNKVIMKVNDYYKQQHFQSLPYNQDDSDSSLSVPFLTPSTSMINLQQHHKKFVKSESKRKLTDSKQPSTARTHMHHSHFLKSKPNINISSARGKVKAPIKVKCFNSNVLEESDYNNPFQNPNQSSISRMVYGQNKASANAQNLNLWKMIRIPVPVAMITMILASVIERFHKQMLEKHKGSISQLS